MDNKTETIRSQKFLSDLHVLERNADILAKIRKIRKECLSNGAYSEKNMEEQNSRFDKVDVPQWERDIINESWDFTNTLSHNTLRKLEKFCKEYKELIAVD